MHVLQWQMKIIMNQSLRDYEALALLARSEAHATFSVSRRLASQGEALFHFSCSDGALH